MTDSGDSGDGSAARSEPGTSSEGIGSAEAVVVREGDLWLVGGAMPPAWRLAVWRGDGATLWWDAADPEGSSGVLISDAHAAAPWIADLCGDAVAELLAGADGPVAGKTHGTTAAVTQMPLARHAREVALARWRNAWWPASRQELIPPLDPRLVAAERAVALHRLASMSTAPLRALRGDGFVAVSGGTAAEGLTSDDLRARAVAASLVDDAALDAALRDLAAAEERYGALPEPDAGPDEEPKAAESLASEAHALAAARGVEPEAAAEPAPVRAALHRAPEPVRASVSGSLPIDLSYVPNGVVDAVATAHWRIVFRGAAATIVVEVLAAPRFADDAPLEPDLHASFAGITAKLTLADGVWRAEQPVPLTMLTSPPADRTLLLYVPGRDVQRTSPDAADLIRVARARLLAPSSASEADAAARDIR